MRQLGKDTTCLTQVVDATLQAKVPIRHSYKILCYAVVVNTRVFMWFSRFGVDHKS